MQKVSRQHLFVDFSKAFDSIHRGKMQKYFQRMISLETEKVHSPDEDIDFFDMVTGVLQGDTLAPYLFIFCLDYVLQTSIDQIKENGFTL